MDNSTKVKNGKTGGDDDDVMDIVKPVVIVGCIFLVFVGVFVYCFIKRRQFLKEQKERKISMAPSQGDRRSVVTMSGWMNHAARNAAKMSTVTVLSEDVMYNPTRKDTVDMPYTNGGFIGDISEEPNPSYNNQTNEGTLTPDLTDGKPALTADHNNINNNNINNNNSDNNKGENNIELKVDPALLPNQNNDNVSIDSNDGVDHVESNKTDTNPENGPINIAATNPENVPSGDNIESNIDNEVVGEPLGNSTRKSDDDQDESDVGDYATDVDDEVNISSPTRKTAIVPDISGSSLPSLSGSLPSNNFFDQMMTEYDKMSSLTRN